MPLVIKQTVLCCFADVWSDQQLEAQKEEEHLWGENIQKGLCYLYTGENMCCWLYEYILVY